MLITVKVVTVMSLLAVHTVRVPSRAFAETDTPAPTVQRGPSASQLRDCLWRHCASAALTSMRNPLEHAHNTFRRAITPAADDVPGAGGRRR